MRFVFLLRIAKISIFTLPSNCGLKTEQSDVSNKDDDTNKIRLYNALI